MRHHTKAASASIPTATFQGVRSFHLRRCIWVYSYLPKTSSAGVLCLGFLVAVDASTPRELPFLISFPLTPRWGPLLTRCSRSYRHLVLLAFPREGQPPPLRRGA
jgi:hypothetical protein